VNYDCAGVTQVSAFETVVADYDVVQISMLEYHAGFADRDTFAAIRAFFCEYNIGPIIATVDGALGANLHALTTLCADLGLVYSRLWKMCFYSQGGLLGINLAIMTQRANLHTQATPAAPA
jgi:hypothetical protein